MAEDDYTGILLTDILVALLKDFLDKMKNHLTNTIDVIVSYS